MKYNASPCCLKQVSSISLLQKDHYNEEEKRYTGHRRRTSVKQQNARPVLLIKWVTILPSVLPSWYVSGVEWNAQVAHAMFAQCSFVIIKTGAVHACGAQESMSRYLSKRSGRWAWVWSSCPWGPSPLPPPGHHPAQMEQLNINPLNHVHPWSNRMTPLEP